MLKWSQSYVRMPLKMNSCPSKEKFNSCKDAALHLKSQLITNGANPPDEGAMTLVEGDSPVEHDLNVAAEDEVTYGNPCRDMVLVVDNHQKVQNKKRKRKPKALKNDKSDFNGFGVINVNGKKIDLLYLARDASDAFEANLNKMTEGMVRDAEFMGCLKDLEGEWSSTRKRRKFVDATIFGDALPKNWKILLSLRPRVYPRSLYCRKFESPSGIQFKSCKEAAFYIKSLYDANLTEEEAMILRERGCQVGPESVARVPRSYPHASEFDSLRTNGTNYVPIQCVIQCNYCTDSFMSMGQLESHLHMDHMPIIHSLYNETLTQKHSVPCGTVVIQEKKSSKQKSAVICKKTSTSSKRQKRIPMNGEGSSRFTNASSEVLQHASK